MGIDNGRNWTAESKGKIGRMTRLIGMNMPCGDPACVRSIRAELSDAAGRRAGGRIAGKTVVKTGAKAFLAFHLSVLVS